MLCERRDLDRTAHIEGTLWAVVSVAAVSLISPLSTEPLVLQEDLRCAGSELPSSRSPGYSALSPQLR